MGRTISSASTRPYYAAGCRVAIIRTPFRALFVDADVDGVFDPVWLERIGKADVLHDNAVDRNALVAAQVDKMKNN